MLIHILFFFMLICFACSQCILPATSLNRMLLAAIIKAASKN